MGWGPYVVSDALQLGKMDESEIFMFGGVGDGGVKAEEAEAAMTHAID